MSIKSNSKRRRVVFFVWMFVVFFGFKVEGRDLVKEIVKLAEESRELDKKIVERMTFKLAKEQIPIGGDNEKYILKDIKNNVWLFKPDSRKEVQTAKMISDIARLLGVGIPVLEEITLPINGKNVFGSIQKIGFNDILRLDNVLIKEMSSIQISSLQKLQVLDWLLVFNNSEINNDCFIVSKNGDEILGIDRDDAFRDPKKGRILGLKGTDWENSLYAQFWNSYLKREIDIKFEEVFELINYIQDIEDDEFKKILIFLNSEYKKAFLEEILWRKANLKREFEKFYWDLAKKRGETFHLALKNGGKDYLEIFLKMIEGQILIKKIEYKGLIDKGEKKQKNIEVVSAREMWYYISCWIKNLYEEIGNLQEIAEKFQGKSRENPYVGEHLAMELYLRQLKMKERLNVYRIIEHPKRLNPIKIEYNLRSGNYDIFLNNNLSRIYMLEEKKNILAHLKYMRIMEGEDRKRELILKYKQEFKENPNSLIGLFFVIMSQAEYFFNPGVMKVTIENDYTLKDFLGGLSNQFPWKYYGYAFCDYGKGCPQDGIKNCEKIIHLNNDKEATYAAYMLLSFFYEHNSKNIRFGEGFNIKKAIKNYKKALKINPDSEKALLNLGNLYLIEGLPTESLREFKKFSKLTPQYAKEHFHLEDVKESKNQEKFLESIRMNTLTGGNHYILGLAYLVKENKILAQKHFDKSIEFGYKMGEGRK